MGRERRAAKDSLESPLVPFPLMSISLAGISNEKSDFANYADLTNQLVEVKQKAKQEKGSVFVWKH